MSLVDEAGNDPAKTDEALPSVATRRSSRPSPSFATALRDRRLAAGLTQAALAARAGLSARGVQNIERGVAWPRRQTAERLARALGLEPSERAGLLDLARSRPRAAQTSTLAFARPGAARRPLWPSPGLPASVASFVGREQQLAEIDGLLRRQRLVTLTGTGGAGKTRLALEVVAGLGDRFADGIWVVSLAPLGDPRLVETAVGHALGLRESLGQPLRRTLEIALRDRELLLVLDNFEHLLKAAPLVTAWLELCPGLTILATSREPLRLPGEQVFPVPPLVLPASLAGVETSEAVRLFVERAASAQPGFRLTDANGPAVVEICRRLDGMPLAIELAAAWTRTLSPTQIAARLDDRFRLLVRGSRAAPLRQRTLRATLDWSYALLSDQERTLLRRLSVFAGGWTLEAAEAVCADRGEEDEAVSGQAVSPTSSSAEHVLPQQQILSVLPGLVDKSLVITEEQDGAMRFDMLETIRSYGLERLHAADDARQVLQRHLDWMLATVQRAELPLWTSEQGAWLERLDRELPNIRAALAWCVGEGGSEAGLRLTTTPWRFWEQRGYTSEARRWLDALLGQPGAGRGAARAMGLALAAYLAVLQGDLLLVQPLVEEGLAIARHAGDQLVLFYALLAHSHVRVIQGDLDGAQAPLEECQALVRDIGWMPGEHFSLMSLGELARARGDFDRAAELIGRALALSEAAGDAYSQSYYLTSLAHLALQRGDAATATGWYRRALILWHELRDVHNVPRALEGLAWAADAEGQPERAAHLLGAAEALREAVGAGILPLLQVDHAQVVSAVRAALGARAFEEAWGQGRAMTYDEAVEYALHRDTGAGAAVVEAARPIDRGVSPLSQRERDIAVLVAQGQTSREVAETLCLSKRTVDWYVARLLDKLGLRTRAQLAAWTADQRLDTGTTRADAGARER